VAWTQGNHHASAYCKRYFRYLLARFTHQILRRILFSIFTVRLILVHISLDSSFNSSGRRNENGVVSSPAMLSSHGIYPTVGIGQYVQHRCFLAETTDLLRILGVCPREGYVCYVVSWGYALLSPWMVACNEGGRCQPFCVYVVLAQNNKNVLYNVC